MSRVLVVGATRGLGACCTKQYASQSGTTVYGTTRHGTGPSGFPDNVKWLSNIDLIKSDVGDSLVSQISESSPLSVAIISAGHFTTEDFSVDKGPNWDEELRMYTTSAIAPVFVVHRLAKAGLLAKGSKVLLVSSESGSIGLRHESEGGGNYAHHASKTALNMAGRLLSLDLKDAASGVHEDGDDQESVTPDEAAKTLMKWVDDLDMSKTGEFWAPRGPGGIGTAEATMGSNLPTPLKLPW